MPLRQNAEGKRRVKELKSGVGRLERIKHGDGLKDREDKGMLLFIINR